jgi:environmental stress-induced protein Ves
VNTTLPNACRSRIIRLHDCPLQPWKNGLGGTREIAVQPSSASIDDFIWRVSVAEVSRDAPFSSFPGIDRQIVLLDGAGLRMTLDDALVHDLTTPFMPFAFAGEARVMATLVDGPTRDFNLMLRRGQARGEIMVRQAPASCPLDPSVTLVHAVRGVIDTPDGPLRAGDSWRPETIPRGRLHLRHGALALLVRIDG